VPSQEATRIVELLQAARPMRLFRNCRYLSRASISEILALTSQAADDEPVAAVGQAVRTAKQAPLTDGRRLPSREIDEFIARLRA
jgi:hypothetical protein